MTSTAVRCLAVLATGGLIMTSGVLVPSAHAEPAPPGPDCEWYGTVEHVATYDFELHDEIEDKSQHSRTETTYTSGPVDGVDCGAIWTSSHRYTVNDTHPAACPEFEEGTSVTTLVTEGDATGTGRLFAVLPTPAEPGGPSLFQLAGEWGVLPVVTSGQTVTCGVAEPYDLEYSQSAEVIPEQCEDELTVADADAQAVAGECENLTTGPGWEERDVYRWNLVRVVCDQDIDSDGGGVSDCDEHDQGTDPSDPTDDVHDDLDHDGIKDVDDNCLDTPNPGQADLDQDLLGDACDNDIDGDGLDNTAEVETSPTDADSDDDTVLDGADQCPTAKGVPPTGCPASSLSLTFVGPAGSRFTVDGALSGSPYAGSGVSGTVPSNSDLAVSVGVPAGVSYLGVSCSGTSAVAIGVAGGQQVYLQPIAAGVAASCTLSYETPTGKISASTDYRVRFGPGFVRVRGVYPWVGSGNLTQVREVCVSSTWRVTVKGGKSTVQMMWNGDVAPFQGSSQFSFLGHGTGGSTYSQRVRWDHGCVPGANGQVGHPLFVNGFAGSAPTRIDWKLRYTVVLHNGATKVFTLSDTVRNNKKGTKRGDLDDSGHVIVPGWI